MAGDFLYENEKGFLYHLGVHYNRVFEVNERNHVIEFFERSGFSLHNPLVNTLGSLYDFHFFWSPKAIDTKGLEVQRIKNQIYSLSGVSKVEFDLTNESKINSILSNIENPSLKKKVLSEEPLK